MKINISALSTQQQNLLENSETAKLFKYKLNRPDNLSVPAQN
jgi:hypothetical protein